MEIPFEADISMEDATSLSSGYITMEWRGQQHASRAVESTASGATAAIQLTSSQSTAQFRVQLGSATAMCMSSQYHHPHKSSVFQYSNINNYNNLTTATTVYQDGRGRVLP